MIEHEGKIWLPKCGVCIGSCLAPVRFEIYLSYVDRTIVANLKSTAPQCEVFLYLDDYLIVHLESMIVKPILPSFHQGGVNFRFKLRTYLRQAFNVWTLD